MKKGFLVMAALLAVGHVDAKVKMASLFGDGMVLQQRSEVKMWGWAKAGATVTAKASWNGKAVKSRAAQDGRWELRLTTPEASFTPYEVIVSDGERLTLKDVLIGEVWVGSGQSNMEMCLAGRPNRVIENVNRELLGAHRYRGKLRMATVPHNAQPQPVDEVAVKWEDCSTAVVAPWSAVCYFFGTTLIDALDCPVGMISTCWGGTSVESWSPASVLPAPATEAQKKDYSVRYNGMIHPLKGYTIKGFIWYQGEANVNRHEQYAHQLSQMITSWRQAWGQGDLPFYQVEIAPFAYGEPGGIKAACLREAQLAVTHSISHCGLVCTNDLVKDYELHQIHPMMKRPIGERLAGLALTRDYDFKGLYADSPEYTGMEIKDEKVYLNLSHTEKGFNRFDDIKGFEVSGPDGIFLPATARLEGVRLVVSAPKVHYPKAVRYCFKNWQPGNLANVGGMPVFPFRTDK